ncbi:MAG: hypothetical protein PHT40_00740 [Patescibacteria group bacterium]|nr:hypothetical protein [Patescibacteria group bacterium]
MKRNMTVDIRFAEAWRGATKVVIRSAFDDFVVVIRGRFEETKNNCDLVEAILNKNQNSNGKLATEIAKGFKTEIAG